MAVGKARLHSKTLQNGNAADFVRILLRKSPGKFQGTYRLMCGGKLGEVFFAGGLVRDLRRQLPNARIVLDCWPGYAFVAKKLREKFSDVVSQRSSEYFRRGIHRERHELRMSLFRCSPMIPGRNGVHAPFYRVFARSAGAVFSPPAFEDYIREEDLVLALPTMNRDASARGRLPFSPTQWGELTETLDGFRCVATGAPGDGSPGPMPGWDWVDCDKPGVVELVRKAKIVIGGNSGLVFMAGALEKHVVMLNDVAGTHEAWWDPHGMIEMPGLKAIKYLRLHPSGSLDPQAFPFTQKALEGFREKTPPKARATGAQKPQS